MKTTKILLSAALAMLMLTNCGGGANSPKDVVLTVFNAAKKLDFETMKKHLTQERISDIERIEKMLNSNPEERAEIKEMLKNAKFEILSEEISADDNSAVVTIKTSRVKDKDDKEDEVDLVKIDGIWKFDSNPF
ncbi:MAG: DUF4878 domain-containing protein [Prevotellaceae bacterium]|jgi:hypothetical protein|nr:DUF4878 domain-containing protein [Prevotellaceae bacterium]